MPYGVPSDFLLLPYGRICFGASISYSLYLTYISFVFQHVTARYDGNARFPFRFLDTTASDFFSTLDGHLHGFGEGNSYPRLFSRLAGFCIDGSTGAMETGFRGRCSCYVAGAKEGVPCVRAEDKSMRRGAWRHCLDTILSHQCAYGRRILEVMYERFCQPKWSCVLERAE